MRIAITYFSSFYETLMRLDDPVRRDRLNMALLQYSFDGTEPDLSDDLALELAFINAKPNIDANLNRSDAAKANGSKGGRPRKRCKSENVGKACAETEPETDCRTELETDAETEAETNAETYVETEAKTDAETKAKTQAKTEGLTEQKTQAKTQAKTEGFANENQNSSLSLSMSMSKDKEGVSPGPLRVRGETPSPEPCGAGAGMPAPQPQGAMVCRTCGRPLIERSPGRWHCARCRTDTGNPAQGMAGGVPCPDGIAEMIVGTIGGRGAR